VGKPGQILIVEDHAVLAEAMMAGLRRRLGAKVGIATNGLEAVRRILKERPDVVVLDIGLPDIPGIEVLRQVKATYRGQILVLTGEQSEKVRVEAHHAGAAHWISKPIGNDALAAQIGVLFQGAADSSPVRVEPKEIEVAGLRLERSTGSAFLEGERVGLGPKQFIVLWTLACQPDTPVPREILSSALGMNDWSKDDRAVDMLIHEIRQKLGDAAWGLVVCVRGEGYVLRSRGVGGGGRFMIPPTCDAYRNQGEPMSGLGCSA